MRMTFSSTVFTLLMILTLLPTSFAQEIIPPWHLATLEGHTGEIESLQFSPDYSILASGSADGTVRLWETATGKHINTLEGHAWSVAHLSFSADSRTLVSAAHTEVWVWDVASGRRKATFDENTNAITGVALNANGTVLASSSDKMVEVWNVATGTRKATLEHRGVVASMALSADGDTVASGISNTIVLWDVASGQQKTSVSGKYDGGKDALAFSPNGRTLAAGEYHDVFLLDAASGKDKARFSDGSWYTVTDVRYSADGRTLAVVGSSPNQITLLDIASGEKKTIGYPGEVRDFAFSGAGGMVASGVSNTIVLWDVASGQQKTSVSGKYDGGKDALAFSPNGRTLAAGEYHDVFLLDAASGKDKANFSDGSWYTVTDVRYSADGRTLAVVGSSPNQITLLDIASGEKKNTLEHDTAVRGIAFSTDSSTLASAGQDWDVVLWDIASGEKKNTLKGHTDWVNTVVFNPSGGTLVSGSSDGTVRVWSAATGGPQTTFEAHAGTVEHVVFSPDGTMLASLSAGEIKLWNTTTWQRTATFPEPANNLTSITFCLDGRALAIGNEENVRVWDFVKGIIKFTIPRQSTSLAFGDSSRTLAIGHGNTVYLWNLAPPKWELSSSGEGGVGTTPSTDSAVVSTTGQKPDLVVDSVRIEPASDPKKLYLYATLRNQGTAQSTATTLQYYLSTDDIISPSDTVMLEGNRDALPPNGTFTRRFQFTAPTSPGTYYYGACVDSIPNESNTDNNCSGAVSYTVGADGMGLTVAADLISEVAYGPDSTYFVLNAQFPALVGVNGADVFYGKCTIKVDLPSVPDKPVSITDKNNSRLDNPGYFMVPLATPRQRIGDEANELAVELIVEGLGLIPIAGDFIGILYEGTKSALNVGEILKATADPQISLTSASMSRIEALDTSPSTLLNNPLLPTLGLGGLLLDQGQSAVNKQKAQQIAQEGAGRPNADLRFLFFLNGQVPKINIEIEQTYFLVSEFESDPVPTYTATYAHTWKLENSALAAPSAQPMSLTNYPAFQSLPSETQAYLLQYFGTLMNTSGDWQVPEQTSLLPNYPNPFNPETWIPYQLAEPADVTLTIYDINGRVVRNLDFGHQRAGIYYTRSRAAYWDGRNAHSEPVASGVYFYTLKAGDFSATRKMLIRK